MRPMKLRSHLLLLCLGTVFPLIVVAAAAAWIFFTGAPVIEREMAWLIVLGVSGTLSFAVTQPRPLQELLGETFGLKVGKLTARVYLRATDEGLMPLPRDTSPAPLSPDGR